MRFRQICLVRTSKFLQKKQFYFLPPPNKVWGLEFFRLINIRIFEFIDLKNIQTPSFGDGKTVDNSNCLCCPALHYLNGNMP